MLRTDPGTAVLVACELPTEENLGARYVAQALVEAGFSVRLLRLNRMDELTAIANEILGAGPRLVGLSMSDNQAAAIQLTLAAYLRARGFAGRIVAGGAFATVTRHELLLKHEGLDAIVRREGEYPMVLVARAAKAGEPLDLIPGVTTRAGDGPAYVEPRVLPVARPLRDALPKLLGLPMARVMASRGCTGSCGYCGSSAVRHEAVAEARRAGLTVQQIQEQNLGRQRCRSLDDFADEIAELYHERGARFFRLIDDHVLGPDEPKALAWLRGLAQALESRGVVRAAFSMMVEPSVVTEALADAMADLGVVRVLVGVEALTESGLSALGRNAARLASNRAAVQRLFQRGMAVFYNSIFLHPASTAVSVRAELEALPFVAGVPFDVLPLLVFPGTAQYRQLERESKLLGGILACDYVVQDPTISRMRSMLHGLSQRFPELAAASLEAHEIAALDSLSRRLGRGALSWRWRRELHELIDELGILRKDLLLTLLDHAESSDDYHNHVEWLERLVLTARPRLGALFTRFAQLRRLLEPQGTVSHDVRMRHAAAALAVSFIAVGSGCGGAVASDNTPSSGGGLTATGGAAMAQGGAAMPQGGTTTWTTPATGGSVGLGGATTPPQYLSADCGAFTDYAIVDRLDNISWTACQFAPPACGTAITLRVDDTGAVVDVVFPSEYSTASGRDWEQVRLCLIKVLSQERYPCLTDGFSWYDQCVLLIL